MKTSSPEKNASTAAPAPYVYKCRLDAPRKNFSSDTEFMNWIYDRFAKMAFFDEVRVQVITRHTNDRIFAMLVCAVVSPGKVGTHDSRSPYKIVKNSFYRSPSVEAASELRREKQKSGLHELFEMDFFGPAVCKACFGIS